MSVLRRRRLSLSILLFLLAAGCGSGQGQHVHVLFEDTDGLERGDPVRYQDFEVGTVERLEPVPGNVTQVGVTIRPEHTDLLREGLQFRIEETEGNGNAEGNILAMSVPDPDAPSLPDSATVLGRGDDWEIVLEELRGVDWQGLGEKARDEASRWLDSVDWESLGEEAHRELERLRERLRRAVDSAREEGG